MIKESIPVLCNKYLLNDRIIYLFINIILVFHEALKIISLFHLVSGGIMTRRWTDYLRPPRVGATLLSWFLIEVSYFHTKLHASYTKTPKRHTGHDKCWPEWVLLLENIKFIKEGIIGTVGVVIMHAGKPVNAIDCKMLSLESLEMIIKIIFYFTFKRFLSGSLISFICTYCIDLIFTSYFWHPLLCCDLLRDSIEMTRSLALTFITRQGMGLG